MNMCAPRIHGFGLVELMVAMALGLLLTTGILTLYLNMSRSSSELAKTNLQIENGRLAIQLLRDDLVHAGFWNGYVPEFDDLTLSTVPVDYPAVLPAPCAAYSSWTAGIKSDLLGTNVQLYSTVAATGCSSVVLPSAVAGSDVLLARHAHTCVAGVGNCEADTVNKLYFQTSLCDDVPEARYVLADSGFSLHQRNCTTVAEKRKYISNIYYLRDYAVSPGDGIPTLMQSSFDLAGGSLAQQPAVAMIEGVEAMRFELGVDNNGDGGAVNFTQAVTWASATIKNSPTNRGDGAADALCTSATCTLDDMINTVQIKVYLLVRDLEPSPGYNSDKTYSLAGTTFGPFSDNFKRHVYATTVRLSNISGRRETP